MRVCKVLAGALKSTSASSATRGEVDVEKYAEKLGTAIDNLADAYDLLIYSLQPRSYSPAKATEIQSVKVLSLIQKKQDRLVLNPAVHEPDRVEVMKEESGETGYLLVFREKGVEVLSLSIPPASGIDAVNLLANIDTLERVMDAVGDVELAGIIDAVLGLARSVRNVGAAKVDVSELAYTVGFPALLPPLEVVLGGKVIESLSVRTAYELAPYLRPNIIVFGVEVGFKLRNRSETLHYKILRKASKWLTAKNAELNAKLLAEPGVERDVETLYKLSKELLDIALSAEALLNAWKKFTAD